MLTTTHCTYHVSPKMLFLPIVTTRRHATIVSFPNIFFCRYFWAVYWPDVFAVLSIPSLPIFNIGPAAPSEAFREPMESEPPTLHSSRGQADGDKYAAQNRETSLASSLRFLYGPQVIALEQVLVWGWREKQALNNSWLVCWSGEWTFRRFISPGSNGSDI